MQTESVLSNEQLAANAFSAQSAVFDELYGNDSIILYKRQRVRNHLETYLPGGCSLLELNAGTGEDALYFSSRGYNVHATDLSSDMLDVLANKSKNLLPALRPTLEVCSFTELLQLNNKGPFDCIFSNFAGLNCTADLGKVLTSLPPLLNPGGIITLVIMPRFCLWEILLAFKGKFRTAFRRFSTNRGTRARVEGNQFRCWYYPASFVKEVLSNTCEVLKTEGLCTLVPPSYMQGFAEKHPVAFKFLCALEEKLKSSWPWRSIGDYYIITLRKREP